MKIQSRFSTFCLRGSAYTTVACASGFLRPPLHVNNILQKADSANKVVLSLQSGNHHVTQLFPAEIRYAQKNKAKIFAAPARIQIDSFNQDAPHSAIPISIRNLIVSACNGMRYLESGLSLQMNGLIIVFTGDLPALVAKRGSVNCATLLIGRIQGPKADIPPVVGALIFSTAVIDKDLLKHSDQVALGTLSLQITTAKAFPLELI